VGRRTDSIVLLADALHYQTAGWTNGGVLLGLVLLWATGSGVFDALIAIGVAGVILGSAYRLLLRSVQDLMDAALPEPEQRAIEEVIHRHRFVVASRNLRTRRSGSQRQVDFTILACRHLPLGEAHDLVDHIEKEIEATIPGAHVVVHAEPCGPDCQDSSRCIRAARRADLLAHEP
jgi:cation diffusion facilitator family transporter